MKFPDNPSGAHRSIDISSDNTLLVSSSADKSVKIWGLDFGDLHRSIHAHNDSIMKVMFMPHTHYFLTVSKDKSIKQWDGDLFEQIQTLGYHSSEIWSLCVSHDGHMVVTGGNDKCIKIWKQSDQQLFLDEEKEKQLETMFMSTPSPSFNHPMYNTVSNIEGANLMEQGDAQHVATSNVNKSQTHEILDSSERLIDAIDHAEEEQTKWKQYQQKLIRQQQSHGNKTLMKPQNPLERLIENMGDHDDSHVLETSHTPSMASPPAANPLLRGQTSMGYVYQQLCTISPSDVDDALLLLPYDYAMKLIKYLDLYIQYGVDRTELAIHCLCYLMSLHHKQLLSSQSLSSLHPSQIHSMHQHVIHRLRQSRDEVGYNIAAIKYIQRQQEEQQNNLYAFGDQNDNSDSTNKRKQKKRRV